MRERIHKKRQLSHSNSIFGLTKMRVPVYEVPGANAATPKVMPRKLTELTFEREYRRRGLVRSEDQSSIISSEFHARCQWITARSHALVIKSVTVHMNPVSSHPFDYPGNHKQNSRHQKHSDHQNPVWLPILNLPDASCHTCKPKRDHQTKDQNDERHSLGST